MESQPLPPPPPPPPPPPRAIPYATPVGYTTAAEAQWREGRQLVVAIAGPDRTVHLPARCVKCNAPSGDRRPLKKTVSWHHPGFYALLPAGLLIYALVALGVSKKVTYHAGLCATHAAVRRNRILIGWGIFLASVASLILAIYCADDSSFRKGPLPAIFGIVSAVLFVTSLVWALVAPRALAVRKVTDANAWFTGAGPEFLASLPGA